MDANNLEERRDRLQNTMFVGVAVGATGLALQELCEMLGVQGTPLVALAVLTVVGWLTFCVAVIRVNRIAKSDGAGLVLEDERRDQLRAESFKFGFTAVMAVQVLGLVGPDLLARFTNVALTVSFMAALSIAVGVIAGLGRFVYLNR